MLHDFPVLVQLSSRSKGAVEMLAIVLKCDVSFYYFYWSSKLVHVLLLHVLVILICKFLILNQQDPVDNSTLY